MLASDIQVQCMYNPKGEVNITLVSNKPVLEEHLKVNSFKSTNALRNWSTNTNELWLQTQTTVGNNIINIEKCQPYITSVCTR